MKTRSATKIMQGYSLYSVQSPLPKNHISGATNDTATAFAVFEEGSQLRAAPPKHVLLEEVTSIKVEVETVEGLPVTTPLRTITNLLHAADRDREETRRGFVHARSAGIISPTMISRAGWMDEKSRATLLEWVGGL